MVMDARKALGSTTTEGKGGKNWKKKKRKEGKGVVKGEHYAPEH